MSLPVPALSLVRLSSSSFAASLTGTTGLLARLFYRPLGLSNGDAAGPIRTGDGTLTLAGLDANLAYLVYAVTDDGSGNFSLPTVSFVSLAASPSLLSAVSAKWNASPTLLTNAGQLFVDEVPPTLEDQAVTLPYATVMADRTHIEHAFERLYYEYTGLTFSVFAPGAAAAETGAAELRALFDYRTLPFTDPFVNCVSFRPDNARLDNTFVRYRDGSLVYRAEAQYEVIVERLLPV